MGGQEEKVCSCAQQRGEERLCTVHGERGLPRRAGGCGRGGGGGRCRADERCRVDGKGRCAKGSSEIDPVGCHWLFCMEQSEARRCNINRIHVILESDLIECALK